MSDETERLIVALEAKIDDFTKNFEQAKRTADQNFSAIEARSKQAANNLSASMSSLASKAAGIGVALAAGVASQLTLQAIKDTANALAKIGDNARKAGMDIDAFQRLGIAAERNRISIDTFTEGMKRFTQQAHDFIETGEGSGADAFKRLGYSASELQEQLKAPDKGLVQLIARIQQLDHFDQLKLVEKLFGGDEFLKLVTAGAAKLQDLYNNAAKIDSVFDAKLIKDADELDQQLNRISGTVKGSLLPAFVSVAREVAWFLESLKSYDQQSNESLDRQLAAIADQRKEAQDQLAALQKEAAFSSGLNIFSDTYRDLSIESTKKHIAEYDELERKIKQVRAAKPATSVDALDVKNVPWPKDKDDEDKKSYDTEVFRIQGRINLLKAEASVRRGFVGTEEELTAELDRQKTAQELINAAAKAGKDVTDEMRQQITSLADAYKLAADEARKLAKAQQEATQRAEELESSSKDALKGFVKDIVQGKTGTEALASALNKLSEKLIDMSLDTVWKSLFTEAGKGSNIFSQAGGIFKPTSSSVIPIPGVTTAGTASTPLPLTALNSAAGIDRSSYAAELASNPALKEKVLAISLGENRDPVANQAVMETMMNRASMMKTPLSLESKLTNEGGYYAGYAPAALDDPRLRAMAEGNLDKVLKGSNVANFATDNASGNFAKDRIASGLYKQTFTAGGETFSIPGNANARGFNQYSDWQKQAEAQVEAQKKLQEQMEQTALSTKSLETPIASVGTNAETAVPQLSGLGSSISSMLASVQFPGAKSIFGFSSGGYTGDGSTYDFAGIVHKGEFVLKKDAVSKIGLASLNALNEGRAPVLNASGFASQQSFTSNSRATFNISMQGPTNNPQADQRHIEATAKAVQAVIQPKTNSRRVTDAQLAANSAAYTARVVRRNG